MNRFDLKKQSTQELTTGLDEEDILNGARITIFEALLSAYHEQRALILAKYKKGLKKILDRQK
jgi:hypothetical protein